MKPNLASLIAGSVLWLIALSLGPQEAPTTHFWGMYEVELGSTKYLIVGALVVPGSYFLWKGFRGRTRKERLYICLKTEETFWLYEAPNGLCPRCQEPLEPLEGFYDRHPDLKK